MRSTNGTTVSNTTFIEKNVEIIEVVFTIERQGDLNFHDEFNNCFNLIEFEHLNTLEMNKGNKGIPSNKGIQ